MDFLNDSINGINAAGAAHAINTASNPPSASETFLQTLEKSTSDPSLEMDHHSGNGNTNKTDFILNSNSHNESANTQHKEEINRNVENSSKKDESESKREKTIDDESKREKTDDRKTVEKDKKDEKEKTINDDEKKEKPKNTSENSEDGEIKKGNKEDNHPLSAGSKIKELIKKVEVQHEVITRAKGDIKENFGESKSSTSGDHLEKVMLKTLEDQGNTTKNKTESTKKNTRDHASGDAGSSNDTKKTRDPEIDKTDKTDDKSAAKTDPKLQKKEASQDNPVQLQSSQNKETSLLNNTGDAKVKTVPLRQDLQELYQALKDKISSNVETSIKMMIANGENRVNIQLHPPELGRVHVDLIVKDHAMHAKINAESQAVKEVILSNLDQLKSNLENAGIQINQIDVEVGGFKNLFDKQFGQGNSSTGGRGGRGNESTADSEEPIPADKVKNQRPVSYFLGRSINLTI